MLHTLAIFFIYREKKLSQRIEFCSEMYVCSLHAWSAGWFIPSLTGFAHLQIDVGHTWAFLFPVMHGKTYQQLTLSYPTLSQ